MNIPKYVQYVLEKALTALQAVPNHTAEPDLQEAIELIQRAMDPAFVAPVGREPTMHYVVELEGVWDQIVVQGLRAALDVVGAAYKEVHENRRPPKLASLNSMISQGSGVWEAHLQHPDTSNPVTLRVSRWRQGTNNDADYRRRKERRT